MSDGELRIDVGCGENKREGFVGLDQHAFPGVDHVLDLTTDRWPFDDDSVSHVYSAHFLEHIREPNHVLDEIGRVCRDGATIEIITPYAFSNDAFVYGHQVFLTELVWLHYCVSHRDTFFDLLRGRWLLNAINFVIHEHVERELGERGFDLGFAVKYFKGVVLEFAVEMTYRADREVPAVVPARTHSRTRFGERLPLD